MTLDLKKLFNSPRKIAGLIVVLAMGLLLWGRLMIQNVPRTAVADPERQAELAKQGESGKPPAIRGKEAAKFPQIPADEVDR